MECLTCDRLQLRGVEMARHGFGRCELAKPGAFVSPTFQRECKDHRPADAATVAARREWMDRRAKRAGGAKA